jgi:hypothetical protein
MKTFKRENTMNRLMITVVLGLAVALGACASGKKAHDIDDVKQNAHRAFGEMDTQRPAEGALP